MSTIDTAGGPYTLYHVGEATLPEVHDTTGGEWFFRPSEYSGGDVWSNGYPSEQAAGAAAVEDGGTLADDEAYREEQREADADG